MRFGSVCSGIEAASVAWYPLGWHAAWLSEIDASASAVLAHRFPDVQNLGDMTAIAPMIEAGIIEAPDILVGGTPCQGFSVAGRRGGLADPRGQLTLSFVEILDAIDDARRANGEPECIAVWENVPGVLSMGDNAFGNFLAALAGEDEALEPSGKRWPDAGLVVGPQRAIAWRVLDAQFFGLAQRRKRVFVVASAREGFDPGEILFEFDGVRRDSPPSRQAQQDPAAAAQGSAGGRSHWDGDYPHPSLSQVGTATGGVGQSNQSVFSQRGAYLVGDRITNRLIDQPVGARMLGFGHYEIDETASTMKARDYKDATDLVIDAVQCVTGDITHTLTAEVFDASEDGTGRGTPIVHSFDARQKDIVQYGNLAGPLDTNGYSQAIYAFTAKDHGQDVTEDLSPTLRSGGHSDSHANGGVMPAVAYEVIPIDMRQASRGATMTNNRPEGTSGGAPGTGIGKVGDPCPTVSTSHAPAVAYAIQERAICENPDAGPDGMGVREDVAYTLEARQTPQAVGHELIPFYTTQLTHPANYSNPQPGDPCHPLAAGAHPPSICGANMAVRRLLPVECERLQGFPDNWTHIPAAFHKVRKITKLRPEDMWKAGIGPKGEAGFWLMSADGPRYKQCGNSMARNCMAWIGGRIKNWLELEPFRELIG